MVDVKKYGHEMISEKDFIKFWQNIAHKAKGIQFDELR